MATMAVRPLKVDSKGVMVESLDIERTGQWVESMGPCLNPAWRYIDAAGHEHRGEDLGATLTDVTEDWYCVDCEETHEHWHVEWRCTTCDEVIKPGTHHPGPQWMAGAVTCTLTIICAPERGPVIEETWSIHPDLAERIAKDEVPDDIRAELVDGAACLISALWR